jgi:cysteinyl-tRNA synthetase
MKLRKPLYYAGASLALAKEGQALFTEMTELFGFIREDDADAELVAWIEERIAARAAAKKEKNWAEADRVRDELKARGIEIIDTPQGTKWKRV